MALCIKKMEAEQAVKLQDYAVNVFEPILCHYPELRGKLYLALGSAGFIINFCSFICSDIFLMPCKCYDESYIRTFSSALVEAASKYHFLDSIHFADVIRAVEKGLSV